MEDGSIFLAFNGKSQSFAFPSGAARAVEDISINGWIYWLINNKTLSQYREQYIEHLHT